jgi:hypothetical protein
MSASDARHPPADDLLRHGWSSIARDEQERLAPRTLPGAVSALGLSIEDVREIFTLLPGDTAVKKRPHLRTYVAGQMVPALERKIWHSPIGESENLRDWYSRMFERQQTGLILNGAERWALSATSKIARWLRPQVVREDPLRLCFELIVFAGDYGFTPFGVHRDEPCASVIHFNLGPTAKSLYIFESATALTQPGSLSEAVHYRIEPGDGFVLPANHPHVGDAREFCVDIACKVKFRSDEEVLAFVTTPLSAGQPTEQWSDLSQQLLHRLGATCGGEPVGRSVEFLLSTAANCARSNALFVGSPISDQVDLSGHDLIGMAQEFPIVLAPRADRVSLFSRGQCAHYPQQSDVRSAFDLLCFCRPIQVSKFVKRCGSEAVGRSLVKFLIGSRGVTVLR